jgi:hypothetical protein
MNRSVPRSIGRRLDSSRRPSEWGRELRSTPSRRDASLSRLQNHWRPFLADLDAGSDGAPLPRFIVEEIEAYLRCGILAHGFLRVRCEECGESRLVGLSCKRRGFCPSCIGRRMSDTAAQPGGPRPAARSDPAVGADSTPRFAVQVGVRPSPDGACPRATSCGRCRAGCGGERGALGSKGRSRPERSRSSNASIRRSALTFTTIPRS